MATRVLQSLEVEVSAETQPEWFRNVADELESVESQGYRVLYVAGPMEWESLGGVWKGTIKAEKQEATDAGHI